MNQVELPELLTYGIASIWIIGIVRLVIKEIEKDVARLKQESRRPGRGPTLR
jgi:hypothetical protein